MTMNELKESKIVLEGMEESITSANENENGSQSSFAKSRLSSMSQADQ